MDYVIRKASKKDARNLNKFLTLLIQDEKKYDSNINELCVVKRFYEDIILHDSNIVLIAEINKKIVGYLFGYIFNGGDTYIHKISKLEALYVIEEYRKNGIATSLINEFKSWSKKNNVKYVEVQVLNDNLDAFNLYKREGFNQFKSTLTSEIIEDD